MTWHEYDDEKQIATLLGIAARLYLALHPELYDDVADGRFDRCQAFGADADTALLEATVNRLLAADRG